MATTPVLNVTVNIAGARERADRLIALAKRERIVRWLLRLEVVRWLACRWAAGGARIRIVGGRRG